MRISVVIPTLNAGPAWNELSDALHENLLGCGIEPGRVLVIDSASTDQTAEQAARAGFRVLSIARDEFNHGGTRQLAVLEAGDADFLVFLTQDALPAGKDALRNLLSAFSNPKVGAAYGRQLPRKGAVGVEAHARLFNYPAVSRVRSFEDRATLGLKSIFASNSFCAYRRSALLEVGGFPSRAIHGEDTIAIARMHMAGWCSAYVADAQVYHSHALTMAHEFRRYFDTGAMHAQHPFLLEVFGTANGEGKRFVLSELRYLLREKPLLLPEAILRTMLKLGAYQLGRKESRMSLRMRRTLSMNRGFWDDEQRSGSQRESALKPRDLLAGPPLRTGEQAMQAVQTAQAQPPFHLPRVESGSARQPSA